MAVTKILARRGGLAQAIAYVVNGDKTEEQVLTATQGCSIKSACAEMQDAKIRWNKTDGVQLYHIIQSFRPGEITPGLALEIAQEFVREHLPGYQAVIGIHTDREHIHAHIAFNSINQLTGEKYHSNARSYDHPLRQRIQQCGGHRESWIYHCRKTGVLSGVNSRGPLSLERRPQAKVLMM